MSQPQEVSQQFAVHNQDGRIELFVVGVDGAVYHRWQTAPNGPFAEWSSLGGNVSQPFAIQNQDGRIELFAIGRPDNAVWHRWQTAPNGPLAEWDSLGGDVSQLFAIHNQDGRIELFAIGRPDNAVWHRWQTAPNGPFAEWDSLGGEVSQPFAIHNLDGRIEVLAIGRPDNAVWHRWQTAPNGPFAEWHSLGGDVRQPFAIRNQDGRIELFAIGRPDNAVWHRWQTAPNGPFAEWDSLGGDVSHLFAIHNQDERIELFAIGRPDNAVWHRWQTAPNGPFAEWYSLGGDVRQPFAIRNQDGRIELFAIGRPDNAVWHRWQTAPNGPFAEWDRLPESHSAAINRFYRAHGGIRGPFGFPLHAAQIVEGVPLQRFSGGLIKILNNTPQGTDLTWVRVRFVGFHCLEESDEVSAADEPCFLIGVASANGSTTTRFGPYEDVDAGEDRFEASDIASGANALTPPIVLAVIAMEHDEGTPEEAEAKVREVMESIEEKLDQAVGALSGASTGNHVMPEWARDILIGWGPEAITAILGLGDDEVGKTPVVLFDNKAELEAWRPPAVIGRHGENEYTTVIEVGGGDEGKYQLFFKVDLFRRTEVIVR